MTVQLPGGGSGNDATSLSYGGLPIADTNTPPKIDVVTKSPRWKPTGRGNYAAIEYPTIKVDPSKPFPPVKNTTNAYIVNHTPGISQDDDEQKRARLWVKQITIGWSMEYAQSQTVFGKSFYPRHIKYNDAMVTVQTASQDHYDQLVSLALGYHQASIHGAASLVRFELPELSFYRSHGVWDYGIGNGKQVVRYRYPRMHFDGYILDVRAGHKTGVFNPELDLRFAVVAYGIEVRDGVLENPNDQNPDNNSLIYKRYRNSLDTRTSSTVKAADPVAESGYNAIPGGPGGNQG